MRPDSDTLVALSACNRAEWVGLAPLARPVRGEARGGWFVLVGDLGYWDSSTLFLSYQ